MQLRRSLLLLQVARLVPMLAVVFACGGGAVLLGIPDTSRVDTHDWHELRSPDFILYSQGEVEKLEQFATDLARFVAVTQRLVDGPGPRTPARVFVLGEEAGGLFVRGTGAAAYIQRGLGGFDAVVPASEYDAVRRHVFLHEFSHYLNLRDSRLDYPTWYLEGFAEVLGSVRTRGDLVEVGSVPPWRLQELDMWRGAGRLDVDLAEIFAHERDGELVDPDAFYAISWATVHYLNSSVENRRRLSSMVHLQSTGLRWQRAFARSFDISVEALSERVERHAQLLRSGTVGAIAYLPLDELDVRTEWEIRPIPAPEVARSLGELAIRLSIGRRDTYMERLAAGFLGRAVEIDPNDVRAHAALAALFATQGRTRSADVHLAAFDREPDPPFEALSAAGWAMQRESTTLREKGNAPESDRRNARSIALFERALAIHDDDPVTLHGLGRCRLTSGELDAARELLARAQAHGEWDAPLTLDRGRVELKAGDPDRARRYFREVIRLGSPDAADEARTLLAELEDEG
jgi:FimV-like protein